jgi:hypothetical protein
METGIYLPDLFKWSRNLFLTVLFGISLTKINGDSRQCCHYHWETYIFFLSISQLRLLEWSKIIWLNIFYFIQIDKLCINYQPWSQSKILIMITFQFLFKLLFIPLFWDKCKTIKWLINDLAFCCHIVWTLSVESKFDIQLFFC